MKRYLIIIILSVAAALSSSAQNVPSGYTLADSLVFTPLSAVDSTMKGESIYSMMPLNVKVKHSMSIRRAFADRIESNESANFQGYRIRIFFDNKQNSRGASEAALNRFKAKHPGIGAYRTFVSPYFKVTVGDYRTKSEALAALNGIRVDFPSAFIVKEKFKYPSVNSEHSFRVDTIRILKPIASGR